MPDLRPAMETPALRILDACSMPLARWDLGPWQFPYWRMYWADRPGTRVVAGKPFEIDARHIVLVPPQTTVALRQDRPVRHFYCHFVLGPPLSGTRMPVCRIRSDAWMRQMQSRLLEGSMVSGSMAVLSLTAVVLRAVREVPESCWTGAGMDPRIQQALLDIDREPGKAGGELAERASLSPHAFSRLFRREVGQSLHQYILQSRVQSAANLLRSTDLSVKQIATELGFCDRYHFSRVFRTMRGMPPARFRTHAEANR